MRPQRPDRKKWLAAPTGDKPFQVQLFIRTEAGRQVEATADRATPEIRALAYRLLMLLAGDKDPGEDRLFTTDEVDLSEVKELVAEDKP